MKFHSEKEISEFLSAVDKCTGDVYLKSVRGDCYNLKSELSKYVAIAALLRGRIGTVGTVLRQTRRREAVL